MTPLAIFLAAAGALLIYEGVAIARHRTTISEYVWAASKASPLLPFAVGIVIGVLADHFWPLAR